MEPQEEIDAGIETTPKQHPGFAKLMQLIKSVKETGNMSPGTYQHDGAKKNMAIERLRGYCANHPNSKFAPRFLRGLEHFKEALADIEAGRTREAVENLFEAYMQETKAVEWDIGSEKFYEIAETADTILHDNPLGIPATIVSGIMKGCLSLEKGPLIAGLTGCISEARGAQPTYASHLPDFYFHRGLCFAFEKNYADAKRDFQTVQRLEPEGHEIFYHLAACEVDNDARRELYEKYVAAAQPDDIQKPHAHYQLCVCAFASQNHGEFNRQLQCAREAEEHRMTFLFGPLLAEEFAVKGYVEQLASMMPTMKPGNPRPMPRSTAAARGGGCSLCAAFPPTLLHCAGCKRVFYCGKECQKKHWKSHKDMCRKAKV